MTAELWAAMIVSITPSDVKFSFQMRLWAFLSLSAWLCLAVVAQDNSTHRRTKRQFEADHCDPAYCQIPVSSPGQVSVCDVNRKSDDENLTKLEGKFS